MFCAFWALDIVPTLDVLVLLVSYNKKNLFIGSDVFVFLDILCWYSFLCWQVLKQMCCFEFLRENKNIYFLKIIFEYNILHPCCWLIRVIN